MDEKDERIIAGLEYTVTRAQHAERLLSDSLYKEVQEKVYNTAVQALIDAKTPEDREAAWHRVQAVKAIQKEFNDLVAGGKMAAQKLRTKR